MVCFAPNTTLVEEPLMEEPGSAGGSHFAAFLAFDPFPSPHPWMLVEERLHPEDRYGERAPLPASDPRLVCSGPGNASPDPDALVVDPPRVAEPAPNAPTGDPLPTAEPAPVPDPFDDADALEELAAEITTLAAHIHAATHRLLLLIAEFDRRRGWELEGHRSCAHWLHARTGIDLGAAREKVRTARALIGLPQTSRSMARGELSFSKVRALTRVATGENERDLLAFARDTTTAQVERLVRGFKRGSRKEEVEWERERHAARRLSVFPDDEGMYVVRGRLTPEMGVLLMRAVEAAGDALYRAEGKEVGRPADSEMAAARRRADALVLLAERALGAGFGEESSAGPGTSDPADGGAVAPQPVPISGSRAERYQVVLHVEAETLRAGVEGGEGCGEGEEAGRSELDDGSRISAETSRRISCDAGVVELWKGRDGSVLDVGRRRRTIPPGLRRALEARDRGCRFPGCGLRFAEGHHVRHWADGGETKLGNLVLLCRHHHRLVHEEGWKVDWWGEGKPVFWDPRGGVHYEGRWQWPEGFQQEPPTAGETPATDETEDLAEALVAENRRLGVEPDDWTAGAAWERIEDAPREVYLRALEAANEALL